MILQTYKLTYLLTYNHHRLRRQDEHFLKKVFWEQVAHAGPQNTFLSVRFAPPGDVGARRHAPRVGRAPFNLKSVERLFYRKTFFRV